MSEEILVGTALFSEAAKDPKMSDKDATAIAWVIKNRLSKPKRFGGTYEEVIFAPHQFSGVNTNEWNKVVTGKLNDKEQKIYKRFLQISHGVVNNKIPDPTGGADHYFNPKLVKPSWAKKMEKKYSSGAHDFYKE